MPINAIVIEHVKFHVFKPNYDEQDEVAVDCSILSLDNFI